MNFSVKAKILTTIISLSVAGLGVFGYLSFQTYKKDKLAFVYDYLTNETQASSKLFTMASEDYELFLNSIISRIDLNTKNSGDSVTNFLEGDQKRILGLYYHIPSDPSLSESVWFEAPDLKKKWSWVELRSAPSGLSIIDKESGLFMMKKEIGSDASFAAIVFKQIDLWNLLSSSAGRYNFILARRKVLSKGRVPLDFTTVNDLSERIKESPGNFGLFEMTLEGIPYFATYSRLGSENLVLVNLIQTKKVLLVQEVFYRQIIAFLILMVSISLLIGTFSARWLTWHLDELTHAAQELEKENFDVQIEVNGKDEFATLGTSFNNMSGRIRNLLEELRIYNLELEEKVKLRTRELQSLTDIQDGMLNALGQGFVIIDKEHKILPVYSKAAESMFEVIPNKVDPAAIMGVGETEGQAFKEFFELVFNNVISFDDMAKLAPELRTNSKNQKIQLSYAPINGAESKDAEYVLIVGTDKTAEMENMEKFKKEWNFSQMIQKIASNRFALNKIISESLNMLAKCVDCLHTDEEYSIRVIQRLVHTIKGSFSYFYIQEITQLCHDLETFLGTYYDEKHVPTGLAATIAERIMAIEVSLECYVEHYDSIIQYKDSATNKSVPNSSLVSFSNLLKERDPELQELFSQRFFKTKVGPYFQMYPSVVEELGEKLGKDVVFKIVGENVEVPDGPWEEIFQQFIHFIRNSVDHGIEKSEERIAAGKFPVGEITFAFEHHESHGEESLIVTLKDDGKGVDWERIAAKDPSVTCLEDALERIKTGGISSKDEVSETSGRGVGVSSLFSAVDEFGGTSKFTSTWGVGMSIVLRLPFARSKKKAFKIAA
ncbi:MAG TPA: HAMP domain-containing protein [Bacteriovoracaceae bacterium]|nr:HAMP domain-containing protein [Bacteriovoracaceae bacterium]